MRSPSDGDAPLPVEMGVSEALCAMCGGDAPAGFGPPAQPSSITMCTPRATCTVRVARRSRRYPRMASTCGTCARRSAHSSERGDGGACLHLGRLFHLLI